MGRKGNFYNNKVRFSTPIIIISFTFTFIVATGVMKINRFIILVFFFDIAKLGRNRNLALFLLSRRAGLVLLKFVI